MKRPTLLIPLLVAVMILNEACQQRSNTEACDIDSICVIDSTDVIYPDTMLWGHIGEGCSMNVLEFVLETGDTLYLTKTSELTGEYAEILGDIRNQTDRFVVTTQLRGNPNEATLLTCVNTTEMMGVWKNNNERMAFYADGSADNDKETLKAWHLNGTKLVLDMVSKTEYGETMVNDTLQLLEISETDLRFSNRHGLEMVYTKSTGK